MTADCSLNYKFNPWKFQAQTWGEHVVYRNCFWHSEQFLYTTSSPQVWAWTCNSMNNLPSYCGLVDAKIRASDKNLPMSRIHSNGFSFFHWYFYETLNNLNRILEAIWPFNLLFNLKNQRILAFDRSLTQFFEFLFTFGFCLWKFLKKPFE